MDHAFHLHKSLSVRTWTIISPSLQNADCPAFKCLASHTRSGGMSLVSPLSATHYRLSNNVSVISLYDKNGMREVMILT